MRLLGVIDVHKSGRVRIRVVTMAHTSVPSHEAAIREPAALRSYSIDMVEASTLTRILRRPVLFSLLHVADSMSSYP